MLPKDPPLEEGKTEVTYMQKQIMKIQAWQYTIKCNKYNQGLQDLHNTNKNQCTNNMKQVLSGQPDYLDAKAGFMTH